MNPIILGASVLLTLLSVGVTARGSSTYPAVFQQELGLRCTPACTICHTSPTGGVGTANTAFAFELRELGLDQRDPMKLQSIIMQLQSSNLDVNGDGVTDVQALMNTCSDPNTFVPMATADGGLSSAPGPATTVPTPQYGCAVGHRANRWGFAALAPVAFVVAGRRRRRRADSRHSPEDA